MLIKEKMGNINSFNIDNRTIDLFVIEWYEANKRILHKRTEAGREVVLKFMNESQSLTDGDVLYADEALVIVVDIQVCEVIIINPKSMSEMAAICYEIGNKHIPLFYCNDELLVPYEAPLFRLLTAAGYMPKRESRKLLNQLKTTVSPHSNVENRQTLFSKILKLTTSSDA
ncbi:MAG: urease accessory protein UreE [Segetibacter sp.]|nr:urease accessory protein UreE [Segetibacter sp.]